MKQLPAITSSELCHAQTTKFETCPHTVVIPSTKVFTALENNLYIFGNLCMQNPRQSKKVALFYF